MIGFSIRSNASDRGCLNERIVPMIDKKAFRNLTCGLYVVSTKADDRNYGCVVNTVLQVTSTPAQLSVAVNKENTTASAIQKSGRFCASIFSIDASMPLIGTFGFKNSEEVDKFADCEYMVDEWGIPCVTQDAIGTFSCRVVNTVDVGTHYLFIGEVERAEITGKAAPMTYADYHLVKGGKTPPKASSYEGPDAEPVQAAPAQAEQQPAEEAQAKPRYGWRCEICGYVVEMDVEELPEDFVCPMCGMGRDVFVRIEL